jgi:hypothetical protein
MTVKTWKTVDGVNDSGKGVTHDIKLSFTTLYCGGFRLLDGDGAYNDKGVVEVIFIGFDNRRKSILVAFKLSQSDLTVISSLLKVRRLNAVISDTFIAQKSEIEKVEDFNCRALCLASFLQTGVLPKLKGDDEDHSTNENITPQVDLLDSSAGWETVSLDDCFYSTGVVGVDAHCKLELEAFSTIYRQQRFQSD